MKILACFGLSPSLRSSVARLARDNRGNSAIEFAMIVPLMLVMFFGIIEFSSAVAVDRKISLVSRGAWPIWFRDTQPSPIPTSPISSLSATRC